MNNYLAQAQRAFEENLRTIDVAREPVTYNFYAGMVALTSGLEVELRELRDRLERLEARRSQK